MITIQEIADKTGVSRTTVSNVIHGKTKKVSQATIDKIKKVMDETNFVPNITTMNNDETVTRNIGVVTYKEIHGMNSMQDPFVGEFLGTIEKELRKRDYHLVFVKADAYEEALSIISAWNMDGLIILGYTEEEYIKLKKKLNKKLILVDAYPEGEYTFYNVGINDYDGGYQVGKYLYECGYKNALFLAEMPRGCDLYRWKGFKDAMELHGEICDEERYIIIGKESFSRGNQYRKLLPKFLEAKALAFSSDFNAVEAIGILKDLGYKVPDDISVVGFDDNIYASLVRPKLTTVRQNVEEKAKTVVEMLFRVLDGDETGEKCVRKNVQLIERNSVKK